MTSRILLAIALASASGVLAQPNLRNVRSAAGSLNPGLPGYGIARGSLMAISGSTSSDAQTAAFPLSTSLNGVSIKIAVGGNEVDAYPVSIGAGRIVALVPSQTLTGTGTVRVTDANGTSEVPVTIVDSNFGIFAQKSIGSTSGAAYALNLSDAGNTANSLTQTAMPGQQIAILGSGAGATDQDETNPVAAQDLAGDFKLYIGGQLANFISVGRSGLGIDALGLPAGLSGVDWIKAEVPAGVSGCRVAVVAVTGSRTSNFATISVSPDGTTCSDPGFLSSDDINNLPASGTYNLGVISMNRFTVSIASPIGNLDLNTDSASASFERVDVSDYRSSAGGSYISIGSCIVTFSASDGSGQDNQVLPTLLDAGAAISLKGPKGTAVMRRADDGSYASVTASGSSSPLFPSQGTPFADAGAFTASNGDGGADVQAFTANFQNPQPFTWTNAATITSVQRDLGVNITWSGGSAGSTIMIAGSSSAGKVTASFVCSADSSAGAFQVPAAVTLALPASGGNNQGGLMVLGSTYARFTAPGIDQGAFVSTGGSLKNLSYK